MSIRESDRWARAVLASIQDPRDPRIKTLVAQSDAVTVLDRIHQGDVSDELYMRALHVTPEMRQEECEKVGARLIIPGDEEWPFAPDVFPADQTPLALWAVGPLRLTDIVTRGVSIIGDNNSSRYASRIAYDMAHDLTRRVTTGDHSSDAKNSHHWVLVADCLSEISRSAHRGALSGSGRAVIVSPSGIGVPLPCERELYDAVSATGLIVSETPANHAPSPYIYPHRARLIAALSVGTVVIRPKVNAHHTIQWVEQLRTNAHHTIQWAEHMRHPVIAVPDVMPYMFSHESRTLVNQNRAYRAMTIGDVRHILAATTMESL